MCVTARRNGAQQGGKGGNVRVLVEELGAVVDLIVDNHVDVLGGVVLSNILHGEFLCRGHDCGIGCDLTIVERRELVYEVLSRAAVGRADDLSRR